MSLTNSKQESWSNASSKDANETDQRIRGESHKIYENFGREKDNSPTVSHGYLTKEKGKK